MIRKRRTPPVKEKETDKVFLLSHESGETSVAVVEDGKLEELYLERESAKKIYGNIYKAVVKSIVPAIDAAFVDIGVGKDGFLYLNDVADPYELAVKGDQDFWRSHILRKRYSTSRSFVRALIAFQYLPYSVYQVRRGFIRP